jgi:hypothetical protein
MGLSPSGVEFSIQVKSISYKTYFLFQESLLKPKPTRFVVFVFVPVDCSQPPEYFVMNNIQFIRLAEEQKQISQKREKERGEPYKKFSPGINYPLVARPDFHFRNAWDNLPK